MKRVPSGILAFGVAVALVACGSAAHPDGESFEVPTWSWDKDEGMAALVSGRLAFTEDGCTLLFSDDEMAQPVVFPNAVGMRFGNGVRAVIEADSGKVYAIEGQEFEYAGGWVRPDDSWTAQCGEYVPDDVAYINDLPAFSVPSADPEPHTGTLPTSAATFEERGWYAVPTFEWDPAQGGDGALLEGTITMTVDGCATVVNSGHVIGLVLPNAWGTIDPGYAGGRAIFSWFPESSGIMAEEGMEVSFGGGGGEVTGEFGDQWERLCPGSPIDSIFLVHDDDPWE